jgi:hypothetical protein
LRSSKLQFKIYLVPTKPLHWLSQKPLENLFKY